MTQQESKIVLPLRTSVDLFSDERQPSAVARAKQAAVLHDQVYVELGFLEVTLTEHGGLTTWTPPDRIRPEQIERARRPPAMGAPMMIAIGPEAHPGEPASKMTPTLAGPISMAYGAEWHSEVLEPLQALGVDFLWTFATGGGDISTSEPIGEAIYRQNSRDSSDELLMPGVNTFRRDFIYKSFNRDLAVARDIGAVVQVSTLFEPMLQRHGWNATGATALEIAVPNLAALEWEQVLAFRAHPGAQEAREMLRKFERMAADEEPQDAREYLLGVSQRVTDGLMTTISDRSIHLPRAVAEEAAKAGMSFIPFVGPFVGTVLTAAELAAAQRDETRSGVAALMMLRAR